MLSWLCLKMQIIFCNIVLAIIDHVMALLIFLLFHCEISLRYRTKGYCNNWFDIVKNNIFFKCLMVY